MRRFLPGLLWLSVTTAAATTVGAAVRMAVHRVDGGSVPVMEAKASAAAPAPDQQPETTAPTAAPTTQAPVRPTSSSQTPTSNRASDGGTAAAVASTTTTTRAAGTTTTTHAARTTTSTPAADPTTTTTTAPPPSTTTTTLPTYTYEAKGGTVAVQCKGDDVSMVYANPAGNYAANVSSNGPRVVDVTFDSRGHHSEIRVTCTNDRPQPTVTERGS